MTKQLNTSEVRRILCEAADRDGNVDLQKAKSRFAISGKKAEEFDEAVEMLRTEGLYVPTSKYFGVVRMTGDGS